MNDTLLAHMAKVADLMNRILAHYETAQPQLLAWEIERGRLERALAEALTAGEDRV